MTFHVFVLRGLAMTIPVIVALIAKHGLPADVAARVFVLITDVVLLAAVLKLGVDAYAPGCAVEGRKIIADRTYCLALTGLSAAALVAGAAFGALETVALAVLAVQCMALAESSRIFDNYAGFYLLKAPPVYVGALALGAFATTGAAAVLLAAIGLVGWLNWRRLIVRSDAINPMKIAAAAGVSLLMIAMAWKEPALTRWFGGAEHITPLVFYTRLKILVTFLFMVMNAQVPNALRALEAPDRDAARRVARRGRRKTLIWGVGCAAMALVYAWVVDRDYALGAALLLAAPLAQMLVGNVTPVLIFYRRYRVAAGCYIAALGVFGAVAAALSPMLGAFLAICAASLAGHAALALLLARAINRIDPKAA